MVPVVAIAANGVENEGTHLISHSVFDAYVSYVETQLECMPLIVPCFRSGGPQAAAVVECIDGLLLPGSLSNVHPSRYASVPAEGITRFDAARDSIAFALLRAAVAIGLPALGICRGLHEINCVFGGSLHQAVHELPDRLDHRAPRDRPQHLKYGPAHAIVPTPGSWLESACLNRSLNLSDLQVNSLHGQAVARLGEGLAVDAYAPDGVVEAISMPGARGLLIGTQWHPEWHVGESKINAAIRDLFRDEVHRYRSARPRHQAFAVSSAAVRSIV